MCLLAGVVVAVPVSAQDQLLDDWSTPHGALNATLTTPVATQIVDGPGIIAAVDDNDGSGERDIRVEFVSGTSSGQTTSSAGTGSLSHGEVQSQGVSFIIWDGADGNANAATFDGNNNVTGGGLKPTGLRGATSSGVDFISACPASDPALSVLAGDSDNSSSYDVTFDVFTDADSWATLTLTEVDDGQPSILTFPFSQFSARGSNTSGASFSFGNIGAIRMTVTPDGQDVDLTIQTPVFACGIDLGDAAASLFGGALFEDSRPPPNDPLDIDAQHAIVGPRLGAFVDAESTTAAPNAAGGGGKAEAIFDDNNATANDEDGITFPSMAGFDAGDTFSVTADVQNVTNADGAFLCGWIDFTDTDVGTDFGFQNDDNGTIQGDGFRGERVCTSVDTNQSNCSNTGTDQIECTLDFVIPNNWNGDNGDPGGVDDGFLARFRLTTDWASASDATLGGRVSDGEVEDYLISSTSLPVTINSFETRQTVDGLLVEWGTGSETLNAGFAIWGDRGDGLELLTSEFIPSKVDDAVRPQNYEHLLSGVRADDFETLFVSAVDLSGKEEIYGAFDPLSRYGRETTASPIPWQKINRQSQSRLAEIGAVRAADGQARQTDAVIAAVDVTATGRGMHEVSYQQLADSGLALAGVDPKTIAVTLKGEPVARQIVGGATFGLDSSIRFWVEAPTQPDALYVENYSYRISENPDQVKAVVGLADESTIFVDSFEPPAPVRNPDEYTARIVEASDNGYHFGNPAADPWFIVRLRANSVNSHAVEFELDAAALPQADSSLRVRVAGLTFVPENPDHRIRLEVNGQVVGERDFDGNTVEEIDLELPAGVLQAGINTVRVVAPGGTQAQVDHSLLDSVELRYGRRMIAKGNQFSLKITRQRQASILWPPGSTWNQ